MAFPLLSRALMALHLLLPHARFSPRQVIPRYDHVLARLGSYLYALGGVVASGNATDTIERLDLSAPPGNQTWTLLNSTLPLPLAGMAAVHMPPANPGEVPPLLLLGGLSQVIPDGATAISVAPQSGLYVFDGTVVARLQPALELPVPRGESGLCVIV